MSKKKLLSYCFSFSFISMKTSQIQPHPLTYTGVGCFRRGRMVFSFLVVVSGLKADQYKKPPGRRGFLKDDKMSDPSSSIQRFSSRTGRLSHVFLKDRLAGAKSYRRIAGYFRSSIFELVDEEIEGIDSIEIVCNSDLDPRDITSLPAGAGNGAEREVERRVRRDRYPDVPEALPAALRTAEKRQGEGAGRVGKRRSVPARQGGCDREPRMARRLRLSEA